MSLMLYQDPGTWIPRERERVPSSTVPRTRKEKWGYALFALAIQARRAELRQTRVLLEDVMLVGLAFYGGLRRDEFLNRTKIPSYVHRRQVVGYLMRDLTGRSFPVIGNALGGRNHTTVIHNHRKIAKCLTAPDPSLRAEVELLRNLILVYAMEVRCN